MEIGEAPGRVREFMMADHDQVGALVFIGQVSSWTAKGAGVGTVRRSTSSVVRL